MMLNWGVIGAGSIATTSAGPAVHAASNSRLYAVASRDPARGSALEPVVTYTDYRATATLDMMRTAAAVVPDGPS